MTMSPASNKLSPVAMRIPEEWRQTWHSRKSCPSSSIGQHEEWFVDIKVDGPYLIMEQL